MKLRRALVCGLAGIILIGARLFAVDSSPTNPVVTTPAVYVPDVTHENEPLPDGVLAWASLMLETNVPAETVNAFFDFSFTNVTTGKVAIMDVHPSCGCTTAQLPPLPWIIAPGTNEQFGITVNIAGKNGTLYKAVTIKTDKGLKQLMVKITILPPVIPTMTAADRERNLQAAKNDRQAVFRGDCAVCHVKPGAGKYGQTLYDAVCGICHEGNDRATMVPDLHHLKTPTNEDFWRTWIAHGKPGTLMPAFSIGDGGPLSDMQIASLAGYLNATIPSPAPAAAQ